MAISISDTIVVHDDRSLANIANFKTVSNTVSILGSGNINLTQLKNLGTMNTTSGTTQSLTGLTLTNYKYLMFVLRGVSHNGGTSQSLLLGSAAVNDVAITQTFASTSFLYGISLMSLTSTSANTGLLSTNATATTANGSATSNSTRAAKIAILTSNTTILVAMSAGATFDAGSITVYGVQ